MVTESEAYFLKTVEIPCEQKNINFYAQEIGFSRSMLERETKDIFKQWFNFFISYSEQELENANEKLIQYRTKLNDFDKQQRLLQPV